MFNLKKDVRSANFSRAFGRVEMNRHESWRLGVSFCEVLIEVL